MNSSQPASNETPGESLPEAPLPLTDEQQNEVSEIVAKTPKTLPLKRGNSPLFVPATLPHPAEESVSPEKTVAPENAASETPDLPLQPEPQVTPISEVETAKLDSNSDSKITLPQVEFFPPAEVIHHASVTLELRSDVPDASVRYALNAEDVGEDGLLYNPAEKIFLTQSTSVAARTFVNGQAGPLALAHFEIAQPGWQKLEPTDQSDPTTHEAHDEAILEGSWRLAAASVRGKLHAHRGGWREDAYRHGLANAADGTYSIVVVSDGAGSASLSRVGSNLLCETVLDFLRPALETSAPLSSDAKLLAERDLPPLRAALVESGRLGLQKLRDEAANRNRPLSDFACTLLILVRREWNGQQLCAALQSGDGGIALWNQDDTLTLLGAADHGEHSSETRFLTSGGMEDELPTRVKFSIRSNLRATAVMTDGVADDFFPETVRFPEIFGRVLPLFSVDNTLNPGAALLQWINYEKKGSSDDRAIVVSWQEETGAPELLAPSDAEGSDGQL